MDIEVIASTPSQGVVFHIDDSARWKRLLANVHNFLKGAEGALAIEVLANGDAVSALTSTATLRRRIGPLARRGVRFLACENSLAAHGLSAEDLLPEVGRVPAGVVHLAERQWLGWAYIKP